MSKIVNTVLMWHSAFGDFRADSLPPDLIQRVEDGTKVTFDLPCPTCGRGGGKREEFTEDALDAMEELEAICEERWMQSD